MLDVNQSYKALPRVVNMTRNTHMNLLRSSEDEAIRLIPIKIGYIVEDWSYFSKDRSWGHG